MGIAEVGEKLRSRYVFMAAFVTGGCFAPRFHPGSIAVPTASKNAAPMKLRSLRDVPAILDEKVGLGEVLSRKTKKSDDSVSLAFSGVWGGIRGLLAAALTRHHPHVLVLLPQAVDADIVAGDVSSFGIEDVVALPLSAGDGTGSSIRDADYAARLQVLQRLRARDQHSPKPLVVTSYIGAAIQRVPSVTSLEKATRELAVGDIVDPEVIRRWLAEAGFAAVTAVQVPGEFASRGGLLDVYSPDQPQPIRIEWFDDEIESIRRFDAATQRSSEG